MNKDTADEKPIIGPDMTILDIVSRYRQTEGVFKQYDEKAGVCLCCEALFDPLKEVADRYGLDLDEILTKVELVARDCENPETGVKGEAP